MRAIAIVVCLLLVAACGGPDTAEPTAGFAVEPTAGASPEPTAMESAPTSTVDEPTAPASDPCETAFQTIPSRKLASITPADDTTRTLATSWVYFNDIHELAWASHLIVREHVVADCGEDDEGERKVMPDFDPRMLVEIDALYRGEARETILIPSTSDSYSSDSSMTVQVGDDLVLFLSQPDGGGAFPTGGPQGHWYVHSDRVIPNAGHFPTLPVDTFVQSLAAALHQEPPAASEGLVVSLAAAPLGPDLPDVLEPPTACDSDVPPSIEYIERAVDIVWLSERVVVGTVSEIHDAFYPNTPAIDAASSLQVPVTDYVVRIDQHLRGAPVEAVTVRQPGGTVDGCEVRVYGAPDLQVGDRLLLS